MKILGIVASSRKFGNTELMVRQTLLGAKKNGAEVAMLRLSDFNIKNCEGCLYCVIKKTKCRLNDDFNFLIEKMAFFDGIVLGAPVYFLTAPAIIKSVVDRFLSISQDNFFTKKAVTFGVAGRREWARMCQRHINILPLAAGYEVVDSLVFEAAGPGEILLDSQNLKLADRLAENLLLALSGKPILGVNKKNRCPICWGDSFLILPNNRVECPLCYVKGNINYVDENLLIDFEINESRFLYFGESTLEEHNERWVRKTVADYRKKLKNITELRHQLNSVPIEMISP